MMLGSTFDTRMLACGPIPNRKIRLSHASYCRFTERLFQRDRVAARLFLQRGDERQRVRHHYDLGALGSLRN